MSESIHKAVLLNEAIEGLNLKNGGVVIDGTFGGGGHSLEICKRFPKIKIIALDQDKSAFEKAKSKFEGLNCDITFINTNFRRLDKVSVEKVDAVILDLGLSSDQLENSGRGFSFMKDEPLYMTMKDKGDNLPLPEDVTAFDVVNNWEEKNLADIIYGYGQEVFARRIAKGIVEGREKMPIRTTFDLVKIIGESVPAVYRRGRIHYATKTFQAIRIAVNDELGALKEGLEQGVNVLASGGRMAVISFHSLEDRIVKRFYSAKGGSASGGKEKKVANIITKKPITASIEEIRDNPRSRSAKLRILEKI